MSEIVLSSKTIILIEDSSPVRELCADFLRDSGYHVIEFNNGLDAWAALRSLAGSEYEQFLTAVISDIAVPKMDGFRLLKNVRSHNNYQKLPFIFVTGHNDKNHIQMGRALGCSLYITKPVTPIKLLERIRMFLKDEPRVPRSATVTSIAAEDEAPVRRAA